MAQKKNKIKTFLAPMAGYSDRALRDICRDYGADIVFSEMINCYTLINVAEKAKQLLQIQKEASPIAVQIFGSEADKLAEGAKILEKWGVDYIDLNVGCPVKKIVKTGAGSALMKTPNILKKVIKKMRKVINNAVFSIKIRAGWDLNSLNFVDIGLIAQRNGVDFITIHGRTRSQQFKGEANWDYIKVLNDKLNIPVVGNGDITSLEDAREMVDRTGVSAVMIGRKAIERPVMFNEIKNNQKIKFEKKEKIKLLKELYREKIEIYGEEKAVVEMRKIIHRYIKGWPNAKRVRMAINKTKSFSKIKEILS